MQPACINDCARSILAGLVAMQARGADGWIYGRVICGQLCCLVQGSGGFACICGCGSEFLRLCFFSGQPPTPMQLRSHNSFQSRMGPLCSPKCRVPALLALRINHNCGGVVQTEADDFAGVGGRAGWWQPPVIKGVSGFCMAATSERQARIGSWFGKLDARGVPVPLGIQGEQ